MPTEAKEIFEATSKNVRELLTEKGLGFYVPPYQRPFGWDKEKVAKLAEDTLDGFSSLIRSEESFTFLGTLITIHDINNATVQPIVRTEVPAKVLTVIDGQQRLTTLLAFCMSLHNSIALAQNKLLGKRAATELDEAESWLDGQARRVLDDLSAAFQEPQSRGADGAVPVYPRMIRAFDDQWARSESNAKYVSPIAHLTFNYGQSLANERTTRFRPKKRDNTAGDPDLVDRFVQIGKILDQVADGSLQDGESLPDMSSIVGSKHFQRALVNHDFPTSVCDHLAHSPKGEFLSLLRLVLLSGYLLNRVALTVVRGKNEDYAFSVFESLNTTGEPLTAFETFQPRVVSAEGITSYESSASRKCIEDVNAYLASFKAGDKLQNATRDLLISFALAETGLKLSKRLADQRKYLKEEYERHEQVPAERLEFVAHLRDAALFKQKAWEAANPTLHGLPPEFVTDSVRLCLAFLKALNHTVAVAPLVRFYSKSVHASDVPAERGKFEEALKAMTAFSVLWRASRRTTENIDREYRGLLTGADSLTGLPPLARSNDQHLKDQLAVALPEPTTFKAELRARLAQPERGGVVDKDAWVKEAMSVPIYSVSTVVARFLLLAAYHDADLDGQSPGLVVRGKDSLAPCLTYAGWTEEQFLSLEHVAPQSQTAAWLTTTGQQALYEPKETIHRIGNLVLVPSAANSSLGNRPWLEKRVLFSALGSPTRELAEAVLGDAANKGLTFAASTETLANASRHVRHLEALATRESDWDLEFVEARSRRLLELAWDRLYGWLE
jgi:hypothetical protein